MKTRHSDKINISEYKTTYNYDVIQGTDCVKQLLSLNIVWLSTAISGSKFIKDWRDRISVTLLQNIGVK